MLLRGWWAWLIPSILLPTVFFDLYELSLIPFVAALVVISGQVTQPWLRRWSDGKGWWGSHNNRYAEYVEGAAVGIGLGII